MKLFDPFIPAQDTVYIALGDYGHLADARNHVKELWQYFEPYADPHFPQEIAVQFHARYWEMYLGRLAIRVGLPLMPSNGKGPDLRITLPTGRNLFIEATARGAGTGQNRVPEPKLNKVGDLNVIFEDIPVEQVVLRITSGVEDKFKAYKKYLEARILLANDPYVVAVNPGAMTFARGEYDPPLIIQSLFAVGNLMVLFDRDDPTLDESRYSIRHQIIKHNHASIGTNFFLDSEYRGLKPNGSEFKLVHNPYAENPIDRGLFKIGCEYWVEEGRIHSTNWNELIPTD